MPFGRKQKSTLMNPSRTRKTRTPIIAQGLLDKGQPSHPA